MTKSTERKIVWQKYVDPLNSNIDEVEWPGHEPVVEPTNVEFYDFSNSNIATVNKELDEDFFKNLSKKIHSIRPLKIVNTKLGLLTVTENAVADYHFDFWLMHTNFPITEPIAKEICQYPGVDAFIPMTKYRCKIGFPKSGLFNVTEVKLGLQKQLCNPVSKEDLTQIEPIFSADMQDKIDNKISDLKSKNNYWALFVLPNGSMEVVESESSGSAFQSKLQVLNETQKLVGGRVFRS